jgi:DNA-binding LytR/AlgR family response regulator
MGYLKIGIVEDEAIIADNLCRTLSAIGYDVCEPAASYAEALEMIELQKPDLLILDIQIKGKKDGIELAEKVKESYNIPFIFLTANADIATIERAKKTNPPAYLVKPFSKDELFAAIEICFYNFELNNSPKKIALLQDSIFIKEGAYFTKVDLKDILYLESEHVYVNVHTKEKKFLVRKSMQQYVDQLDPKIFFRIHRGFIINLNHIEGINTDSVLVNGISLPISKACKDALLNQINW